MNALEMLDERAERGGLNSVIMTKVHNGGWQVSVKSAITDSYAVRRAATPGEALRLALELLPTAEAYDQAFGLARINAKPDIFDADTNTLTIDGQPKAPAAEPAGVFD